MQTEEKTRVVILSLGEEMYPQDYLDQVIGTVRQAVIAMDVQVVYADTVMSEHDGQRVREALKEKTFDVIIANFVSWHITPYVMQALKDYTHIPILVWGIGGKTYPSGTLHSPAAAAGITAFVPLLKAMKYKYHIICEKPDTPIQTQAVEAFLRLCGTARSIRNSHIGLIGYADMGLYTCSYDKFEVFNELGIDIEDYFAYEITQQMDRCAPETVQSLVDEISNTMHFQNDIPPHVLDRCARLYWAMKQKSRQRSLDAISIKCVNGVTGQMGINPCLAQSLLAGKDLSVICECDAYGLITNVILTKLTNQTSAFMENYEVFDDAVLVGVCGFIPADFVQGRLEIRSANLGDTNQGISNVSKVKTGLVTFARLYRQDDRFKMFISRGQASDSPKWTELGWNDPTPDFPSVMLTLEMPVQTYLETVPGQHIIMVYGDWKQQLVDLCKLMYIQPVCP